MKIGIAGTSKFNNYNLFDSIITKIIKKTYSKDIEIVILENLIQEDNYIGVPFMASRYSQHYLYKTNSIPIDFYDFSHKLSKKREKNGRTYNANAGLIQNKTFLSYCDFFIVFHRNEQNFQYLIKMANDQNITFFNFNLEKGLDRSSPS